MKAVDPPRKMKMWNNIETKCAVHYNENFPYDEPPVKQAMLFEEEIHDTPTFTQEQKIKFCNRIYSVPKSELPKLAKLLARLAEEQDK